MTVENEKVLDYYVRVRKDGSIRLPTKGFIHFADGSKHTAKDLAGRWIIVRYIRVESKIR
jgi:hypothetical protein